MTGRDTVTMGRREGLVEALDRLIDVGVTVSGDAIIRLADVDLIHLDLRLLLAAVAGSPATQDQATGADAVSGPAPTAERGDARPELRPPPARGGGIDPRPSSPAAERPGERLDQGLAHLVVAVVELVRQLLERQAIRRMRAGTLDAQQLERLGDALQALEARMVELRDALGVTSSELDHAIGTVEDLLGGASEAAADGQRREL